MNDEVSTSNSSAYAVALHRVDYGIRSSGIAPCHWGSIDSLFPCPLFVGTVVFP